MKSQNVNISGFLAGLFFFFYLLTPTQALSQTDNLELLQGKADSLSSEGRYNEAEPIYRRIVKAVEEAFGPNHPYTATSLNNFANNLNSQGRYIEAEPLLMRSLKIREKALGADHQYVAGSLNNIAFNFQMQGSYGEAELFYKRSLEIWKKTLGDEHPYVAQTLSNIGQNLDAQGRHTEAESVNKRSLEIREKVLGSDHPDVANSLNSLGTSLSYQGRYYEAELSFKRSLKILEKALGTDHPILARLNNNIASNLDNQGRYAEAEDLYKRSLELEEKFLGPDHPNVALTLGNIASNLANQGRYEEAEALYKRSLEIQKKALGPDHPDVALTLGNLALNLDKQGHYEEAETLHKRSLEIREKALGSEHPDVASSLNNIASNLGNQGRYGEAEALYKRSLVIQEKALGSDHPNVATSLGNIATNLAEQGRYGEAEALYKRSLEIREKALGPGHPDIALSLNNIAGVLTYQKRYKEAETLYKRSLEIREKVLGIDHPAVASSLHNIASRLGEQGRYTEAESLYKRSLEIREKVLGANHPDVAMSLNNIASTVSEQGRYKEAEAFYKRSLEIREKVLGANHPDVAVSYGNLAFHYYSQNNLTRSLKYIRKAIPPERAKSNTISQGKSGDQLGRLRINYGLNALHVKILSSARNSKDETDELLRAEAFEAGQIVRGKNTAAAISRMASRFSSGADELAGLIRQRQDAENEWIALDKKLIEALGTPQDKRNDNLVQNIRSQISSLSDRLEEIRPLISEEFPEYDNLVSTVPLSLTTTQSLLDHHEALVAYLFQEDKSYLWVVRKNQDSFIELDVTADEVEEAVRKIRLTLDPTDVTRLKDVPKYEETRAYELYKKIFAPAEPFLAGVHHVIVVPDGALQSLPLGVLITEEPQGEYTGFSGYRDTQWLAKKYALSILPSVKSLKALRVYAKSVTTGKPFAGFGDPILEGVEGSQRGVGMANLFTRGAMANVEKLKELGSLPGTADELRAIAKSLNAEDSSLYLQKNATESTVKKTDLSDVRVLAFATHGLITGELNGLSEPGLVLTPPDKATDLDDGYLTASEVAQLNLNADWVVLSACNTASSDGAPGAEGLSGLAKAFFYAGSRTLLVSHWPVLTDAATALTTKMFAETKDATVGKAEALKRSIAFLIEDSEKNYYAHPMFWAPFSIVGEGG